MRQGVPPCGSCYLMRFEGFQEAIDHPLGARIPLSRNFLPEVSSVALPLFPAFEYIWRVRIEITLTFAPRSDIRSDSELAPMTHGSLTHSKATGNLLGSQPLLLEAPDLLVARLSLSSERPAR